MRGLIGTLMHVRPKQPWLQSCSCLRNGWQDCLVTAAALQCRLSHILHIQPAAATHANTHSKHNAFTSEAHLSSHSMQAFQVGHPFGCSLWLLRHGVAWPKEHAVGS